MKIYTCKFGGHYPVGAVALVVAGNIAEAQELLVDKLAEIGLSQDIPLHKINEVDATVAAAHILLDGDY